jgi:hypothetical protein
MDKNSIIVVLKGGLGNQMFQYASALSVAIQNDCILYIDTSTGFYKDPYFRSFSLECFNIEQKKIYKKNILFEKIRRKYLRFISKFFFNKNLFVYEKDIGYDRVLNFGKKTVVYMDGYFQSPKYFKSIEKIIKNSFKFTCNHKNVNIKISGIILSTNSVCLHVRRDRIDNPATLDYYLNAISLIKKNTQNPIFFIFSDDPEWVNSNISRNIDINYRIIDWNPNDEIEDIWLMSLCNHFIIANSTFSWWAAWLGRCGEKNVIVPNALKANNKDIFPSDWIVL